ncbi:putative RND superfamily exporter protein [Alkalibacillus flavidus]|uniref:RND superfamily exporter protein n=1 Tax=Alkalibacillus flavidus TaxID=546021 RepID=A0ABV2KXJ9_9BACI
MRHIDLAKRILDHKKFVVWAFIIVAIVSTIAQFAVSVNYNMMDYLPDDAPSMEATDTMESAFDEPTANARVMVEDVTIPEAEEYKEQLEAIDGVTNVDWLDDMIDLRTPIEMADDSLVEQYYDDQAALFQVTIAEGQEVEATDAIYELIGDENALDGEAADTATSQKMTGQESMYAAALLIPIIIIILVLSTNSWAEPVFFLTAIGVSVLINLGSNIFIGEISFVTQSVAPILQLAVSLDYAIFLLHSFSDYRKETSSPYEAMRLAIKRSFPAIAASASTTFFGFIALTFMNFGIGADLGVNLVKGILFSFISVMVFLPALTLLFYKWIDKTEHKPIVPAFRNVGRRVLRLRVPVLILVLLLIVPAFLGQGQTSFIYGIGEQPDSSRLGSDQDQIEAQFGQNTPMVMLVPRGQVALEEELVHDLEQLDDVTNVQSYVNTIGPTIPPSYLESEQTETFLSDGYSRITMQTDTPTEGEEAFQLVQDVRALGDQYYGDDAQLLGESVTLYDIKETVERDNTLVNWLTVLAVAVVLIVTFRNMVYPVVLLITIQSAVWFNLSVPYFMDSELVFVGYLIVSTVQLAATVDYGILFTENYTRLRQSLPAKEAVIQTVDGKIFSIFISAAILSSVGYILWITSSNPIVGSVGLLLGRGALLAFVSIVLLLPALLLVTDRFVSNKKKKEVSQ